MQLIDWTQWTTTPTGQYKIDYTYSRSGSTVNYSFVITIKFPSSTAWYNDQVRFKTWLNVDSPTTDNYSLLSTIKGSTSGVIGGREYSYTWDTSVSNKTSGTTPFRIQFANGGGGGQRYNVAYTSGDFSLYVPPAQSSLSYMTNGTTLSPPTINVTKYDSSFYDVLTLYYANDTSKYIQRSNYANNLSFSESDRLYIFQTQGYNAARQWHAYVSTYDSGWNLIGTTDLGTLTITTENIAYINSTSNFNVGDDSTVTCTLPCGGKYTVCAYTDSGYTNEITRRADLTYSDWWKMYYSYTAAQDIIYASNTTSQSGTIYYAIYTYIDGTHIGTNYATCNYYFLSSRCGPSLGTFEYQVTDVGTRVLKGADSSYHTYTYTTDLNKFISGKTTLNLKLQGSIQKSARISSYYVAIPGKSTLYSSGTSGEQVIASGVLNSSGTVYAYIKDTRGFTSSLSFSYTLNDYYVPSFTSVVTNRQPMSAVDPTADQKVNISGSISLPNYMATYVLDPNGVGAITFKYKASSSNVWIDGTDLRSVTGAYVNGNSIVIPDYQLNVNFDQNTQYDFALYINEYYTNVTSSPVIIPISAPLISRRSKKVGINKIPSLATLDVAGNINADTSITAGSYLSTGTNVSVGTYLEFPNYYTSSNNACIIKFKRTDGYFDCLRMYNGDLNYYSSSSPSSLYLVAILDEVTW